MNFLILATTPMRLATFSNSRSAHAAASMTAVWDTRPGIRGDGRRPEANASGWGGKPLLVPWLFVITPLFNMRKSLLVLVCAATQTSNIKIKIRLISIDNHLQLDYQAHL